ncbi:hypothetical protein [Halodurantibacterium flavum]|uniref:Tat pathway signal protein n=1 Tax=Halodurantibacterium flavum TaxID=1382802 RepID=A0ABW4S007_9RHOB
MVRAALIATILTVAGLPAAAQEAAPAGRLSLDLNRADQEGTACRLTFVAANDYTSLSSLVLETVLFDQAGRVAALSLFDFGDLPQGHRRVRQFDVAGADCAALDQLLVNGVASCSAADEPADARACAAALDLTGSAEGLEVAQ